MFKIPFATLTPENGQALVTHKNIVMSPSAGVQRFLSKKQTSGRKRIFAMGNPDTALTPLIGAEKEVTDIAALFKNAIVKKRSQATETQIKTSYKSLGDPDVVHLATHGIFNPTAPQLSHLALTPDQNNDGKLEMHEVYNLDWKGVSLVTLSACSSGKGKLGAGDDLMGLTRGFMFAGSPAVLCSLWDVDDEATRVLMVDFYKHYLGGMSKAQALRSAQMTMMNSKKWSHPNYWSAFVLFGSFENSTNTNLTQKESQQQRPQIPVLIEKKTADNDIQLKIWQPIISRLASDGFDRNYLHKIFSLPEIKFNVSPMVCKMRELYAIKLKRDQIRTLQEKLSALGYKPGPADGLMGKKTKRAIMAFQILHDLSINGKFSQKLLSAIQNETRRVSVDVDQLAYPSVKESPAPVYNVVLQPLRIQEARKFHAQNRPLLYAIENTYGIPSEIIVGMLSLETRMGQNLGKQSALSTLASMAQCNDFNKISAALEDKSISKTHHDYLTRRCQQKSNWAYRELKALIQYVEKNKIKMEGLKGSRYGAIGFCQFMPTNALRYGFDGNKDGRVDLFNMNDAIWSMANFIDQNGWKKQIGIRKSLYQYNPSEKYVNTILAVAEKL